MLPLSGVQIIAMAHHRSCGDHYKSELLQISMLIVFYCYL